MNTRKLTKKEVKEHVENVVIFPKEGEEVNENIINCKQYTLLAMG